MCYPLSFMPVEEPAFVPDPEDNPVLTRVHPVSVQKRPTQRHKTECRSPQNPISHLSTSAFPASDGYCCEYYNLINNTTQTYKYSVFAFSFYCCLFLDARVTCQDRHPCLLTQTSEEMVIDICQVHAFQGHILNVANPCLSRYFSLLH